MTPALRGYCRIKATPITKYIRQNDLRLQNHSYHTKRGHVKINGNTHAKAPFIVDERNHIADLKHTRDEQKPFRIDLATSVLHGYCRINSKRDEQNNGARYIYLAF